MSERSDEQCYCEWDSDYCETDYCHFCRPRVYHPYCDGKVQYVGRVGICFTCRSYSQPLKLCYCVQTINPNIRTHSEKTLDCGIPDETYHDFPGDFPRCLDQDICPTVHYIICASMHKQDCLGVHTRGYMCKGCIPNNKCTAEGCTRLLFKYEKDQSRIEHNLCPLHYVFTCVTCAQVRIAGDTVDDDISHPRIQCIDCDKKTNTIICVKCKVLRHPHTLTYPCETVTTPSCMECCTIGTYWNLIQTPIINALYKTVMWRFRAFNHNTLNVCVLMHLTWHEGDIEVMLQDAQACAIYLKSQRCNAATALVRLRTLPQELRLMILGYI
jgi:hypothetical protein